MPAQALENKLVAYWTLNEQPGATQAADTANGNNAGFAETTPAVGQTGQYGSAYYFDGADYLQTPNAANLTFGSGDFTVSLWVNTAQASGNHIGLFSIRSYIPNTTTRSEIIEMTIYGNQMATYISDSSTNDHWAQAYNTGPAVLNQGWHRLTLIKEGSTMKTYVDATSAGTSSAYLSGFNFNDSTHYVEMGWRSDIPWRYLTGYLDNIAIWDRALSLSEFTNIERFGAEAYEYLARDLGYTGTQIDSLWALNGNDGASLAIGDTTWTYRSNPSWGAGHMIGDMWTVGNMTYLKLGSGLEGEGPLSVPEPATVASLISGIFMLSFRRILKRK
jgi:hypothetical protein